MPEQAKLTSSELGILWITYQQKTMVQRMLEYFIKQADDDKAKGILTDTHRKVGGTIEQLKELFHKEGAVLPIGFQAEDVNLSAPKLYDNGFDVMFLRLMKEISMGMHTLNIGMSYREDIVLLFKEMTEVSQDVYGACTTYLLEKGMLARPPYVSLPQTVTYVEDVSYLGGLNPFAEKRVLNTVEVAHIYHAIESNSLGLSMITGFAQCASKPEVKKYFSTGMELAKNIIKELTQMLEESNIQVPSTACGSVTRCTEAPFSDKLMMYCISLFCTFSIGGNSLGTALSLRNDLEAKITVFLKDIFEYGHEGAKLMIRNGWMEEPPQMENREALIHV